MKSNEIKSYWDEEWKDLKHDLLNKKGKYKISNYGRIISYFYNEKGVLLKLGLVRGYRALSITRNGKQYTLYVHRLVAQHFLDEPSEEQNIVMHLDNNKLNNNYKNLRWATASDQYHHQLKFNPGWYKPNERSWSKLTEAEVKIIKRKLTNPKRKTKAKILARQFGVSEMQISRIKSGENWSSVTPD